jgi:type IV secretory pathway TraG/TraD family ATPase VirD4
MLIATALAMGLPTGLAVGGALAALVSGQGWRWRSSGWLRAVLDLIRDPHQPGRAFGHHDTDPVLWWVVTSIVELLLIGILFVVTVYGASLLRPTSPLATKRQLRRAVGESAARSRAARSRPSLAGHEKRLPMSEVAVSLGRSAAHKVQLYGQHEDSEVAMVGSRLGKTIRRVIPLVLDSPGPVVTTSTKGDVLAVTVGVREQLGPVHVFDPEDVTGWPNRLRWNPISGCEDPDEAIRRARSLVAARPLDGTVTNAGFFTDSAARVLRAWLHAAALGGRTMRDVLAWSAQWADDEPISLLHERSPTSAHWAGALRDLVVNPASEMLGGIAQTLHLVLDPLNSPSLLDSCSPPPGQEFDVEGFLRSKGTLYVVSEGGVGSAGPFTSALVTHIHHQSKRLATRYPDGRLDPPLSCVWDEVANIAAPENLGQLVSDSGSWGIRMFVICHALVQLEKRWGREQAREVWNAATTRLIFGGVADADTLEDLSRLVGEIKVLQTSTSTGEFRRTRSTSYSWERALRIEQLRTLPDGQALLLYRNLPAVVVELDAWFELPEARRLNQLKNEAERRMGRHTKP